MKVCSKCKITKPVSEFNKKSARKDGLESYCKECHRALNKVHYNNNKAVYIATSVRNSIKYRARWLEWKQQFDCCVCGEKRHWLLDFHHKDASTKEFDLAQMVANDAPWARIMKEAAKCDVMCKNCHADTHYQLRNLGS